jgi:hypothetical protein
MSAAASSAFGSVVDLIAVHSSALTWELSGDKYVVSPGVERNGCIYSTGPLWMQTSAQLSNGAHWSRQCSQFRLFSYTPCSLVKIYIHEAQLRSGNAHHTCGALPMMACLELVRHTSLVAPRFLATCWLIAVMEERALPILTDACLETRYTEIGTSDPAKWLCCSYWGPGAIMVLQWCVNGGADSDWNLNALQPHSTTICLPLSSRIGTLAQIGPSLAH